MLMFFVVATVDASCANVDDCRSAVTLTFLTVDTVDAG